MDAHLHDILYGTIVMRKTKNYKWKYKVSHISRAVTVPCMVYAVRGQRGLLKVVCLKGFIPLDISIASVYLKAKMSSPPTLLQLARRSLLKNEALAISALKYLPMELFPPLFKDAFTGKQTNILRAMVAAWPFPCLPVGALMKSRHLETLKAVLDGLDLLINQKDQPR